MDMKLELVPLHVSNVDRAKAFHAEKVGCMSRTQVPSGEVAGTGRSDE